MRELAWKKRVGEEGNGLCVREDERFVEKRRRRTEVVPHHASRGHVLVVWFPTEYSVKMYKYVQYIQVRIIHRSTYRIRT